MNQAKRSPVLIELIIIICFMAIALTVVIQLFADVWLSNRETVWQSHSMLALQDQAEMFKASPDAMQTGDRVYYDEYFLQPQQEETGYYIDILVTPMPAAAGTLYEAVFTAYRTDGEEKQVGEISTAHYVAEQFEPEGEAENA